MKVALVHDWITGMRGGERCLEAFLRIYPQADIYTLVHVPGVSSPAFDVRVRGVSFLNRIPGIGRLYKVMLPLYPLAAKSLTIKGYDLVISLSHAAAKNVRVEAGVPHVCYCFTPMRYAWDQSASYWGGVGDRVMQPLLAWLRRWDVAGAQGVSHFVAISSFVAARIRLFYGRSSAVIAPPVRMESEVTGVLADGERALLDSLNEPFFLCAGALVPYKRIDVAVEAFSRMGLPLVIAGDGSEREKLQRMAGPSVRFLGRVSDPFLWECYRRCRALIFPGIEDFGIIPVECMAAGKPVVGLDAGGLRDSVRGYRPWTNAPLVDRRYSGVFVPKKGYGDSQMLVDAVRLFCEHEELFGSEQCREIATPFGFRYFQQSWEEFVVRAGLPTGQTRSAAQRSGSQTGGAQPYVQQGVSC